MNDLNIQNLKIGDRVGFCRTHYGTFMTKGFGTVTKINGHGHITVKPEPIDGIHHKNAPPILRVFDKHGNERTDWSRASLCSAEWLEEQLVQQAADNAVQRAVQDLADYIVARKCGNGRYNINALTRAEIKRLADNI